MDGLMGKPAVSLPSRAHPERAGKRNCPGSAHPWRIWVDPAANKDSGRFIPSRDRMGLVVR